MGVEDQIASRRQLANMPPQHLAQSSLDAVSLVRWTEDFPNGEPDARTCDIARRGHLTLSSQKPAHGSRAALPSIRVDTLEICVHAQACANQGLANLSRSRRCAHRRHDSMRLRL